VFDPDGLAIRRPSRPWNVVPPTSVAMILRWPELPCRGETGAHDTARQHRSRTVVIAVAGGSAAATAPPFALHPPANGPASCRPPQTRPRGDSEIVAQGPDRILGASMIVVALRENSTDAPGLTFARQRDEHVWRRSRESAQRRRRSCVGFCGNDHSRDTPLWALTPIVYKLGRSRLARPWASSSFTTHVAVAVRSAPPPRAACRFGSRGVTLVLT